MHKDTAFFVAIFATVALAIGWNARSYKSAANNLRSAIGEVTKHRNNRDRLAGLVALLAVLSAVVLYVLAKKHGHL